MLNANRTYTAIVEQVEQMASGINAHGFEIVFKASYTSKSGRILSAMGWTVDSALRNLTKKTNLRHVADCSLFEMANDMPRLILRRQP